MRPMRTAILTLHYGRNYGAILQALSAAQLFDAEIIDHRYLPKMAAYARSAPQWSHLDRFVDTSLPLAPVRFRSRHFSHARTWRFIERRYDLLVCGSDELWKTEYWAPSPRRQFVTSLMTHPYRTLSDFAWLQCDVLSTPFPNVYWPEVAVPRVAFAASIGETDITAIPQRHRRAMARTLRGFALIGVRDVKTHEFVNELVPELADRTELIPDPVFAYTPPPAALDEAKSSLEQAGIDLTRPFAFIHLNPKRAPQFNEELESLGYQPVDFNEIRLSPPAWFCAIGLASCGVTGAMHPLISSLVQNVPCLSIDKRQKSVDLRRDFQIDEFNDVRTVVRHWPGSVAQLAVERRRRATEFVGKARGYARTVPQAVHHA